MNQFVHVLRRAESHLEAPEPHRSRILLEIAQDLDDLYRAYLERGLSEEEAARRAEMTFGASSDVLEALGEVHAPVYVRLLARFSAQGRHRLERALLTVLTVAAVAGGSFSVIHGGMVRSPSPLLWPLLVVLATTTWTVAAAILDLYVRPVLPAPGERLGPMLVLAALSLAIGGFGALVELWRLAATIETVGAWDTAAALPSLARGSELLTVALCLSLTLMLAWFHLRQRALEIQRTRMRALCVTRHPTEGGVR